MSAYRKLTEHIQAKDASGNLRLILVYQDFDESDLPHGIPTHLSAKHFETTDHLKINWLNEKQFEIEATGEILNRVLQSPPE